MRLEIVFWLKALYYKKHTEKKQYHFVHKEAYEEALKLENANQAFSFNIHLLNRKKPEFWVFMALLTK